MAEKIVRRDREPRAHWFVLITTLVVVAMGLTIDGFAQHEIGRAATSAPDSASLPSLASAGPVLDLAGSNVRSTAGTDHTVALTFDDGPDAKWTPIVLGVLRRHHVPGTFFVVGSRVLTHPELVRREHREGDEIGSHTFVHANVAAVPGWRANLELSLTQAALADAAGIHTGMFRPPYSSGTDSVTASEFRAWRSIARLGYLIVLSNRDSEDWKRPGVAAIVRNATPVPSSHAGVVILMHDGGGDRRQTVAALDLLIPALQASGYRFTTLSNLAGVRPGLVNPAVPGSQRLAGYVIASLYGFGALVIEVFRFLLVVIALLAICRSIVLFAFARRHAGLRAGSTLDAGFTPPVTIVVPAYNEEVGIEGAVRSLASNAYPDLDVIVVDDGSTDSTASRVADLQLPNVRLIQQPNAGKAAALNTGIAAARHDIIVTVDGDTLFEPRTVAALVQPFADARVGAVSGNTKVGNRRGILGRWQHIEYVMGFNLDRRMYDLLGCMPTVPGAIGAFRKEALVAVGGVSTDTLAEDTDLTMAIVRAGWRIVYEQRAVAWTEAPASLSSLWKQRYRWSYGTMQAMWKHRHAVRERGPLGRTALPYLHLFQVLLPLLAPVVDLFTLFGVFYLRPLPLIAYWVGFNLAALALALFAFRLDGESPRSLWALPLQQFVYRQLMYLVVVQSVTTAVLGSTVRWHKLDRTGDVVATRG
ncbi:MAG: hypothetical protein QOI47_713 [Actinomycetota bacterium]|nr:hypothetical protein [Actinomycetota bacterium]